MFRILSGILIIGNLEFLIDDEGFTRQSFEEEKIKNNLLIIAVCKKERILRIFRIEKSRVCLALIRIWLWNV